MDIEKTLFNEITKINSKEETNLRVGYSKSLNSYLIYTPFYFTTRLSSVNTLNRVITMLNKGSKYKTRKIFKTTSFTEFSNFVDYIIYPFLMKSQRDKYMTENRSLYEMMDKIYVANGIKFQTLGYIFDNNDKAMKSFIKYASKNKVEKTELNKVEGSLYAPYLEPFNFIELTEQWLSKMFNMTVVRKKDGGFNLSDNTSNELLDRDYYFDNENTSLGFVLSEAIKRIDFSGPKVGIETIVLNEQETA